MNILLSYDTWLTSFINTLIPHIGVFNLFFSFFSFKGSSVIIWLIAAAIVVFLEEKINKKFIIYFVVAIGTAYLVTFGLKKIVQRPRPTYVINSKVMTCDTDFSFPSGHATIAFAASAVLISFDKKRKYVYCFLAVVISLSRIYLHCHYLLDVIAGGLVGYLTAIYILKLKLPKSIAKNLL